MPCPFRHEGEPEQKPGPRNPVDWIRDWYLRDVNISRRVGWSGPTHDAFVAPFAEAYRFADSVWPERRSGLMPSTPDAVWSAVLTQFSNYVDGGVYDPSEIAAALVGPRKDTSFVEYADREAFQPHPKRGFGPFLPLEEALAETFKPEVGMGPVMPGGTPSGIPRQPGTNTPWSGGFGHYQFMADTYQKAMELLPSFRQADVDL